MNRPMVQVTKEQFYAAMGPLNVHPRITGNYNKEMGDYAAFWTMCNTDEIVGYSLGTDYRIAAKLA